MTIIIRCMIACRESIGLARPDPEIRLPASYALNRPHIRVKPSHVSFLTSTTML